MADVRRWLPRRRADARFASAVARENKALVKARLDLMLRTDAGRPRKFPRCSPRARREVASRREAASFLPVRCGTEPGARGCFVSPDGKTSRATNLPADGRLPGCVRVRNNQRSNPVVRCRVTPSLPFAHSSNNLSALPILEPSLSAKQCPLLAGNASPAPSHRRAVIVRDKSMPARV